VSQAGEVRKIDGQIRDLQDKVRRWTPRRLLARHDLPGKMQGSCPTAQSELKNGVLNAETLERLAKFRRGTAEDPDRSLAEIEAWADGADGALQREQATVSSSRTVRRRFVNVPDRGLA
jgi:hypothetical protein